jgi:preprotein translocase subunit YajC
MNAAELGFIIIVGVIVAFYLIVIRPMTQEQKRQQQDIRNLQVGDEVLTTGGLIATVKEIRVPDQGPVELVLTLGPGVEVRALTSAVARRLRPAAAPEGAAETGAQGRREREAGA